MTGKKIINTSELVIFSMYGAIMFLSAQIDIIPNVHPVSVFIAVFTVVYRKKALIPLYVYIFLEGLFGGFGIYWWPMYLYVWLPVWAFTMLIRKGTKEYLAAIFITVICAVHGILFGTLCAPYSCLVMYKDKFLDALIPYIAYGFPFDVTHCIGNIAQSALAIPLIRLICKLEKKDYPFITANKAKGD